MARVAVKAHPRARRTRLTGRLGEAWKLDLAAPPEGGQANDECIRFFAALARVPRARVRIARGLTSRMKVVDIEGISQAEMERILQSLGG